jgi:hypothetical protein
MTSSDAVALGVWVYLGYAASGVAVALGVLALIGAWALAYGLWQDYKAARTRREPK